MRVTYPVIFTETETNILIEVPDLEILTEANDESKEKATMATAMMMARDAIGISCITDIDDEKKLPEATNIRKVDIAKGTFASEGEGLVLLIDVDLVEYRRKLDNKTVRRNVTLPSWLNYEAERAGINVSRVLQEALVSVLGVQQNI